MPITRNDYERAYLTDTCINCAEHITAWKKLLRLFWAPVWCNTSIYWKICCSHKCWGEILERELKELGANIVK